MSDNGLEGEIVRIGQGGGAEEIGVAFFDYAAETGFSCNGDRWFHAASTIKVPILLGLFVAVDRGDLDLDARVHVRNLFFSAADGRPFRVESSRDAGNQVQSYVGRTMRVQELARQMIVVSSNLATNLLVDLLGIDRINEDLDRLGISGVDLRRGVEDEAAFEAGISNRVTANGLVSVLRMIEDGALSKTSTEAMLDILHAQEFRSGIPAGVPDDARVANKTGEISTVAHDAGIVYPAGRAPYVVALLTEWERNAGSNRRATLAEISRAIYAHVAGGADA